MPLLVGVAVGQAARIGLDLDPTAVHAVITPAVSHLHAAAARWVETRHPAAASLQQPVLALRISPSQDEARRFRHYRDLWGDHLPLEIIVSPHRLAARLRRALRPLSEAVVTSIPYHV